MFGHIPLKYFLNDLDEDCKKDKTINFSKKTELCLKLELYFYFFLFWKLLCR